MDGSSGPEWDDAEEIIWIWMKWGLLFGFIWLCFQCLGLFTGH